LIVDDLATLKCLVRLSCDATANSHVAKCYYLVAALLFANLFMAVI